MSGEPSKLGQWLGGGFFLLVLLSTVGTCAMNVRADHLCRKYGADEGRWNIPDGVLCRRNGPGIPLDSLRTQVR